MDISSLSSSSTAAGTAAKTSSASLAQFKAQQGSQLLALLPSPSTAPGLGLNLDIYAAVGSQSQGLLSGGLTALEIANISLGIDMKAADPSQQTASSTAATADAGGSAAAGTGAAEGAHGTTSNTAVTSAPAGATGAFRNAELDAILKEDGFVAAQKDPYVLQTDFFPPSSPAATASPSATPAATSSPQYFSNPSLSDPGLGGLLNSLG